MVHKVVCTSALQFVQDVARKNNSDSFFVAELSKIDSLVKKWLINLPRVRPFYAVHCNSDPMLLRMLMEYPQIGLHCVIRQHLDVALEFADSDRIFYSNPCWTKNNLAGAQSNNVALLGVGSEADLIRMAKNGITNKIILNVCMSDNYESPNACEMSNAPQLLQLASDFGLNCVGIGFDICRQRLGLFESTMECAAQLFAIGRSIGLNMNVLNLGAGFPSLLSQQSPSFKQICDQLNVSLDYYFPACSNVEVIATPGRYFASTVFSLATRIVDAIEIDASEITNDDFDSGQLGYIYKLKESYYGAFGCSIMHNCEPKCRPLFTDSDDTKVFYGTVQGPHNDSFDVIQKQCLFRKCEVGEYLFWPDMGSYSTNNCASLDGEPCFSPEIYYFIEENNSQLVDEQLSDGEDSSSELEDEDPFWMFNWMIV